MAGIRSFDWVLEPLDGQAGGPVSVTSAGCDRTPANVRALGRWRAHLTVRSATGRSAQAEQTRDFRDLVVVALGDSYVAGEGNPEVPAVFHSSRPFTFPIVKTPARWTDRQCHRSRLSWAARAARSFEDSNTAVTFLNLACSGAEVTDLTGGGYKGIDATSKDKRLAAQLEAARSMLGTPLVRGTRPAHAVLLSGGVNDLGFSGILRECAAFNAGLGFDLGPLGAVLDEPCTTDGATRFVRSGLAILRDSYDRLEVGLDANLETSSVRVVEYPSRIMTNGADDHTGCGALSGISSGEARWITDRGDELNAALRDAADRNGWRYVGGVRDAFRRHGYCARSEPWFRSLSSSLERQANKFGTAHPLGRGHAAVGRIVAPTIPAEPEALNQPVTVRFAFTRVRVNQDPPGDAYTIVPGTTPRRPVFGVMWHGSRAVPPEANRNIPLNRWVDVPGGTTTVETRGETIGISGSVTMPALKVQLEGEGGKGFIVTGPRKARFLVLHRRADGWRPGTHTVRAGCNHCSMELQYTVSVLPFNPVFESR